MFVTCGINHKTAPVEVRERVALPVDKHQAVLTRLVGLSSISEAMILSTCNRTEIYCETNAPDNILEWFAQTQNLPLNAIKPHAYIYQGTQAIRHALRVTIGLDSMVLGEPQIFGQMKQAFYDAYESGTIQQQLQSIFQYIFSTAKHIRHQSGIGHNPVSIAYAAVQLLTNNIYDFSQLKCLIIGSGDTATLVAKYLQKQGLRQFKIASRRYETAEKLANTLSGKALTISDISHHIPDADIIVSATACPLPFISKSLVEEALIKRQYRSMFLLDLAVPRDIETSVSELEAVHLYNIDNLKHITEQNMQERCMAAQKAEHLIEEALHHYNRLHRARQAKQVICDYRSQMQDIAQQELQRARQKLDNGACQYQVLYEFSERLVNKLTHKPTIGLKQAAYDNRKDLLDLANYLFNDTVNTFSYEKIT